MINIYKTVEGTLQELESPEKGSWVMLTNPTEMELQNISKSLNIDIDYLKAPLDDEESSRIEIEQNEMYILVDIPIVEEENESYVYYTIPLGVMILDDHIVTTCLKESYILQQFQNNKVKSFFTFKKTRFLLQILFRVATRYLLYLKQIDKMSSNIEKQLHKSTKNKELIQLLALEKSLVYFSTSLKANELVMEKLLRMDVIKRYPEDKDLLEDVIIENKQAIEMANIYSNILSGTMDAFASVISNNLNIVMKFLTSITIVMTIPNILASLYGMNVKGLPFSNNPNGFFIIVGIAIGVSGLSAIILAKKNMF
ncbi:magnesium transport protein CorA [Gottschalkia purinilytica]|uniref:Magnesium transport protein CorA n=1 Tax=Gottschalkia purinilytica TaxID=1503 RepID=A0A0L0WED2_GOTPU|nr:magnesium transporter CorA family protein [Gottschalkia purinilytica]KNF09796.1 magnesium transport protein CorA [Gottschalkia purinilytica]